MKKIVSGIQTTGNLHLGNYLGSIQNWVKIQDQYQSFLFLADLHAHTVKRNPSEIKEASYELIAAYIACGINPEKAIIFNQSNVPAHAELGWILGCKTPIGWLNRMTQFKDKAGKDKEKASCGLYTYPILMAADILLYKPDLVPVGEDQKQHVELTRDIAMAFNRFVEKDYFKAPEPVISGAGVRIMSLKDGTKKMSKTDESELSRINLIDSPEQISKKFMKAKTDSIDSIYYDKINRPEISNLMSIYSALSDLSVDQITQDFQGKGFASFKSNLAQLAVTKISPISTKINQYLSDKTYIHQILKQGVDKANLEASKTLKEIKEMMGYIIC
jgi:tryptophanyl-tRNA synthetase